MSQQTLSKCIKSSGSLCMPATCISYTHACSDYLEENLIMEPTRKPWRRGHLIRWPWLIKSPVPLQWVYMIYFCNFLSQDKAWPMLNHPKCINPKHFGFDLESLWLAVPLTSYLLKGTNEVMRVYLFNAQTLVTWGSSMLPYYKMSDYLINRILLTEPRWILLQYPLNV